MPSKLSPLLAVTLLMELLPKRVNGTTLLSLKSPSVRRLSPQPGAQSLRGLTLNFFHLLFCAQTIHVPPPPPNSSCKTSTPAKSSSNTNSPNHVCVLILTYCIQPGFYESLSSLFLKPLFGVSFCHPLTHPSL